jgi:alkylation response protein AidB-like acyl-CoA dehydrogenase
MDLGLDEQQEMLKNFARDFLEKECPESLVRGNGGGREGYFPELWQKMAQQADGPHYPGGIRRHRNEHLRAGRLLEEFGRALVPAVIPRSCCRRAGHGGRDRAAEELVPPKIASGELIMTMALTEPSAKWTADGVTARSEKDGNEYVFNGTKLFVPDAHVRPHDCRSLTGGSGEDGITLFLVTQRRRGSSSRC